MLLLLLLLLLSLLLFQQQFQYADVKRIGRRLAEKVGQNPEDIQAFFTRNDQSGTGVISYDHFRSLVRQLDNTLIEHEVMTLGRYYSEQKDENTPDWEKLVSIAQEHLRKRNFEGFGKLTESFIYEDMNK